MGGGRVDSVPRLKLVHITQNLAKLVSRNFVTFPKIYLTTFIQKKEKKN